MQVKNNVYDKQQTSDLRWQFLKLRNEQMIAVINKEIILIDKADMKLHCTF